MRLVVVVVGERAVVCETLVYSLPGFAGLAERRFWSRILKGDKIRYDVCSLQVDTVVEPRNSKCIRSEIVSCHELRVLFRLQFTSNSSGHEMPLTSAAGTRWRSGRHSNGGAAG